jgi:hypothetical protein
MLRVRVLALLPLVACTSLSGLSETTPDASDPGDAGGAADTFAPPADDGGGSPEASTPPDTGPACDGGLTSCSGKCVDLQVDSSSCGACDHSCQGTTCTAGKCDPAALATTFDQPSALRVMGPSLYVLRAGGIDRVAKTGGTPVALFNNVTFGAFVSQPFSLAVDANYAYFLATPQNGNPSVYRCALGGCFASPEVLVATGILNAFAVDVDATTLAWSATYQDIKSCPSASCSTASTLAPSQEGKEQIALTKDDIVWANDFNRAVYRCQRSGCTNPTELVGANALTASPRALVVYGDTVYFATTGPPAGSVYSCTLPGCGGAPTEIAKLTAEASSIAVDASGVYWTIPATGNAGVVAFCAAGKACGASPTVLASGRAGPVSVALDDTFVYWVETGGSAFRLAK